MADLEKALQIAARAHEDQKDKDGSSYILHPLRVMSRVESDEARIVAVLHDVVEDTSVTLDDLRSAGFSEKILDCIQLVTHRDEDSYADYVVRLKANPVARQVKLGDLHDNARLERVLLRPATVQRDLARIHRYVLSYKFLTDQITEQKYRELMDAHGK